MTEWQKVYGSQEEKPSALDTSSSNFFVYQRKNIERVTVTDEMSSGTYEMWQYDERKLTKDEYAKMVEEELTATQLALTELYERQLS